MRAANRWPLRIVGPSAVRGEKYSALSPSRTERTWVPVATTVAHASRLPRCAVAGMISQEEKKKSQVKSLTEEVKKLESLKAGSAAMARKLVAKYNGDVEAVKQDAEYTRCQTAFRDFSTTLAEKEQRIVDLEGDLETLAKSIGGHKIQIQGLLRELDKIREEKHDAVADVISAREEQQIADMVAGISADRKQHEYTVAFNGFTVDLTEAEAANLRSLPLPDAD